MSRHSGQFHDVVITGERVFRHPRTAAGVAGLPDQARLLARLGTVDLGVEIPRVLARTDHATPAGGPHLVLTRVPGEPLDQAGAEAAIGVVAGEYARVLRAMAGVTALDGVPVADPGRWDEFAEGVHAELLPLMSAYGRGRAERELGAVRALDHVATGLVHGDLGGENVLWVRGPRLAGIVDWDEAAIGDPAEDLAAIGASYGPALLDHVLTFLGDPPIRHRITAYQGTFALQQALSGALHGDDDELADGLTGYR